VIGEIENSKVFLALPEKTILNSLPLLNNPEKLSAIKT
jgi:hypothetical protein